MTQTFDSLAENYDASRIGYANEVYNHLVDYGLTPKHRILDVGCGTGLASAPLLDNNFSVAGVDPSEPMLAQAKRHYPNAQWVAGTAEKLPFDNASFDVVISAQVLHRVDRAAALGEIVRVLKPGGIVAIWWKHLMNDDLVKAIRDETAAELGAEVPAGGLTGGFKEFYAAPLRDHTLRIVPWRASMPLPQVVQMERSRANVHDRMGERVDQYIASFERRLQERFGTGNPYVPLSYMHYIYLGKK
jgi:ubiquinone/menaquinone biosynthesis C-methylase UbiE